MLILKEFRFIKRQGLDRTFYECENRMWLVDRKRKIPQGIEMDGGSDWVALHRSFCSYLVSEPKGELLQGLFVFYNHTLLPAEVYQISNMLLPRVTDCK